MYRQHCWSKFLASFLWLLRLDHGPDGSSTLPVLACLPVASSPMMIQLYLTVSPGAPLHVPCTPREVLAPKENARAPRDARPQKLLHSCNTTTPDGPYCTLNHTLKMLMRQRFKSWIGENWAIIFLEPKLATIHKES